jgi:hypothetical protein
MSSSRVSSAPESSDESQSHIWIPNGYPTGNGLKPTDNRKDKRIPVTKHGKGGAISTAYLADLFFYGVGDSTNGAVAKWQCKLCEASAPPKTQNIERGYSNLINQHVYVQHPNWKELVPDFELQNEKNQLGNSNTTRANLNNFVDKSSYKLFRWSEIVIMLDLPISIVENPIMRKFTNIPSVCSKTLTTTMDLVVKELEKEISEALGKAPFFGLIFDGSTAKEQTHYTACLQHMKL